MNKQVTFLGCLLAAGISIAANHRTPSDFYAGIGVGGAGQNDTLTLRNTTTNARFFKGRGTGQSMLGKLFLGYLAPWHSLYMAGELYVQKITGRTSGVQENGNIDTPIVKTPLGYGLTLKGGYWFSTTSAFYGIVGVQKALFKLKHLYNNKTLKLQRWRPGFALGVGVQTRIKQHFLVMLEYQQFRYQRIKTIDSSNSAKLSLTPEMQSIALNVAYSWG
jgi:opacity protein-like surface antigen